MNVLAIAWACLAIGTPGQPHTKSPARPGVSSRIDDTAQPVELGHVRWERDFDAALARAKREGKPVFALFQEIPGCLTCQRFGQGPLSTPLLVEAIEELFVPVAVYNNRGGKDAEVLKRYGEPAWNNPVVRFLSSDGKDLLERRDGVWSTRGIAERAIAALLAHGDDAPRWLATVVLESEPSRLERATFAMFCFWTGEARLGSLDGVATTRAGWLDGREVVEVHYDPARLAYADLVKFAERGECASRVFAHADDQLNTARSVVGKRAVAKTDRARDAKASDRKYYLTKALRYAPLTSMQRTKVNSARALRGDVAPWISPRQTEWLRRIERALKSSPDRLAGLQPPETQAELAAYVRELETRLGTR